MTQRRQKSASFFSPCACVPTIGMYASCALDMWVFFYAFCIKSTLMTTLLLTVKKCCTAVVSPAITVIGVLHSGLSLCSQHSRLAQSFTEWNNIYGVRRIHWGGPPIAPSCNLYFTLTNTVGEAISILLWKFDDSFIVLWTLRGIRFFWNGEWVAQQIVCELVISDTLQWIVANVVLAILLMVYAYLWSTTNYSKIRGTNW